MCYYSEVSPQIPYNLTETSPLVMEDVFVPPECECVRWLREKRGINIRGNAWDIEPNVDHPIVGGVVLFTFDSGVAHAGLIKAMLPSGKAFYMESANEEECQVTTRVVKVDDTTIRGYYFANPNQ